MRAKVQCASTTSPCPGRSPAARAVRASRKDGSSLLERCVRDLRQAVVRGARAAVLSSLAMSPFRANPWHRHASAPIYDNPWISVREDQVTQPDGRPGIYGV